MRACLIRTADSSEFRTTLDELLETAQLCVPDFRLEIKNALKNMPNESIELILEKVDFDELTLLSELFAENGKTYKFRDQIKAAAERTFSAKTED